MTMRHVYADTNEQYVMTTIIYANATDSILYTEYDGENYTNPLDKAGLIDLFFKGATVEVSGDYMKPVKLEIEDEYASVTVGTTAYYSSEYEDESE